MNETTKRNIINLVYDIRNNVLAYGMINSKRTTKNILNDIITKCDNNIIEINKLLERIKIKWNIKEHTK